jgi:hypothetical protein
MLYVFAFVPPQFGFNFTSTLPSTFFHPSCSHIGQSEILQAPDSAQIGRPPVPFFHI